MRLLVTRPEPAGARTAARLRAVGHDVIVMPVLQIEFIPDPELGGDAFDALVLTSVNALRALAQHQRSSELKGLPVYTVGRRTAEAARAIGFAPISADGNQHDLVALIVAHSHPGARLLYIAGEHRTGDLGAALAPKGLKVDTVVAYRAVPVLHLGAEAAHAFATGRLDGVLHYSRRSAVAFLQVAESSGVFEAGVAAFHFCLSGPVAEPLLVAGASHVAIAPLPDEEALLELIPAG
jgi:uroporphyrinogen-III synthase